MRYILEERFYLTETDNASRDWEADYKAINSEESGKKFWAEYFEQAWPLHGDEVRTLGEAFTKTLLKRGWTPTQNPYVAYLQIIYYSTDTAIGKVSRAIFETILKYIMEEEDLRGTGIFKTSNIIFQPGFFKCSIGDAEKYLVSQRTLETYFSSVKTYAPIPTLLAFLTSNNSETLEQALSRTKSIVIKPISILGPCHQFESLISQLTGKKGRQEKTATSDAITKIVAQVATPEIAQQLLAYIVDTFRREHKDLMSSFSKTTLDIYRQTAKVAYTETQAEEFDKLIGLSTVYSDKNFLSLLRQLSIKAGWLKE